MDGSVAENNFIAYFIKNESVQAVAAQHFFNMPKIFVLQEAIAQGKMPAVADIESGKVKVEDIRAMLNETRGMQCSRIDCCYGNQ